MLLGMPFGPRGFFVGKLASWQRHISYTSMLNKYFNIASSGALIWSVQPLGVMLRVLAGYAYTCVGVQVWHCV